MTTIIVDSIAEKKPKLLMMESRKLDKYVEGIERFNKWEQ